MPKNKILVVSEIFYPEGGGAEYATYLILKLLAEAGFEITVVTGTKEPARIKGVRYYVTDLLGNWNRVKRFMYIFMLSQQQWFLKLLKDHDILYIPLMAYPLIPISKKYGLKTIVHLHNYAPVRYYGVKYYFERDVLDVLEEIKLGVFHELYVHNSVTRSLALPISYAFYMLSREWVKDADELVCVSRRQAQIIAKNLPSITGNIRVIYNPLPEIPNIEKRLDEKPTLLYVGGGSYIKGYHILAKTLKMLGEKDILKVKFILAGTYAKQQLEELIKLKKKYGIDVEVLGRISHEELLRVHSRVWALLFPSIHEEPLPYAIIESMLLKTIPIASKAGGIPEVVSGTKAEPFLFEPTNIISLINVLRRVVDSHSSELLKIGEEVRNHIIKKFSNISIELLKMFNS